MLSFMFRKRKPRNWRTFCFYAKKISVRKSSYNEAQKNFYRSRRQWNCHEDMLLLYGCSYWDNCPWVLSFGKFKSRDISLAFQLHESTYYASFIFFSPYFLTLCNKKGFLINSYEKNPFSRKILRFFDKIFDQFKQRLNVINKTKLCSSCLLNFPHFKYIKNILASSW